MALSRSQSRESSRTPSDLLAFNESRTQRWNDPIMAPPSIPSNPETQRKRKSLPHEIKKSSLSASIKQDGNRNHNYDHSPSAATPARRSTKSHHKRSQTLDGSSRMTQSGRVSKSGSFFSLRSSLLNNSSLLSDSVMKQARRLVPAGPTDTTRTDYFRLKALGVDPDTPIVPATRKRCLSDHHRDGESKNRLSSHHRICLDCHPNPSS